MKRNLSSVRKYICITAALSIAAVLSIFLWKTVNVRSLDMPDPDAALQSSAVEETEPQTVDMEDAYRKATTRLLNFTATETDATDRPDSVSPMQLKQDWGYATLGLKDITVEVSGKDKPLERAIRNGDFTLEDFLAYARKDAENGFCQESYTSEDGVATFTYTYPELSLAILYDVYETPDGKQHLVKDIAFLKNGTSIRLKVGYLGSPADPADLTIDKEDWGLTFSVEEVTANGILLSCTQSGGQQIGTLVAYQFYIFDREFVATSPEHPHYPLNLDGSDTRFHPLPETMLNMNGEIQIHIDWSEIYGPVHSGNYRMMLGLKDVYDESDVHPLMKNFYDKQGYWIDFTVS